MPSYPKHIVLFPLWWIVAAFLLGQAALALGFPLFPALGGIAWLVAAGATLWLGASRRDTAIAALSGLAAWIALSAVASQLHDFSWDGQAYHQEAILQFASGWNPWRGDLTPAQTAQAVWINGYPKATWIVETMAFQAIPRLEAAKSVGWLLALSIAGMGALVTSALPGSRALRWALYALVLLNPITSCQWCTFMVDSWVAWALDGASLAGLALVYPEIAPWPRRASALALAACLLLLASVKLTGLVYGVYILAVVAGALIVRRSQFPSLARTIGPATVCAVVAGVALGNPYLHNALRHGHPFWPVMGPNKVSIVGEAEHPEFLARSGPVKFLWSLNAYARNRVFLTADDAARWGAPHLKPPFAVRRTELAAFVAPDVHLGGFGPWYGGIFLVGVALLVTGVWRGWPGARALAALWGIVLVSVLINPEAWWVRYVPQAWWLVLIPPAAAMQGGRAARTVGGLLIVALATNAVAVLLVNTAGQAICERGTRRQMHLLAANLGKWQAIWGVVRGDRERFREASLPLTTLDAPPDNSAGAIRVKLIRTDLTIQTNDAELAARLRAAMPTAANESPHGASR